MDEHLDAVAGAFSRKADIYDEFGRDHANLERMRLRVYDHVCAVMPAGSRLLEINAGTGLDALQLVERGFWVHATDLSPAMVAQIQAKIEHFGLRDRLSARQLSFTELDTLGESYDGIVSNFGGLNCIGDLEPVVAQFPRLLRPRGRATVVIMPPICPWELAVSVKDPRVGTRRLRGRARANVEGIRFETTYYTARQVRHAFGPRFRPIRLEGLSIVTPTADNRTFATRHSRLYKHLARIDDAIAGWPGLRSIGDFFILTMEFIG